MSSLILLDDTHRLLHLTLIVEVHLEMHTVAADMVEQRSQLIERHPASHHALSRIENLAVELIPFRRATLRLAHSRRPLHGVELADLQQGRQMTDSPYPIEMIERVVNPLALLADIRLHKPAVVVLADHRRDVTLQLTHLARGP